MTFKGAKEIFLVAFFCEMVGFILQGGPHDAERFISPYAVLGTFLIFIFFALAVLAWGSVFTHFLKIQKLKLFCAFALGTAWASLLAMALGYLGLIGTRSQAMMIVILFTGLAINTYFSRKNYDHSAKVHNRSHIEFLGTLILILAVATMLLKAFLTHGFSDDLRYNLVGPRMWFEHGRIYFPQQVPIVYQCSYWEMLFIWGNGLLADSAGRGLIEGQLFGQWCHVFFGYLGSILALYYIFESFEWKGSQHFQWILAGIVTALGFSSMDSIIWSAKNDWGIAFWVFSGIVFLWRIERLEIAGAFFGLAIAGKLTSAFVVIPILVAWIATSKINSSLLKSFLKIFGALFITAAPIWARNFVATENPFYPALDSIFHSPMLGPTWRIHQQLYEARGFNIGEWTSYFRMLFLENPFVVFLLLLPFAPKPLRKLGMIAIASFFFFIARVKLGLGDSLRLFGPGLLLLGGCGILILGSLIPRLRIPHAGSVVAVAILVIGFTRMEIPWRIWVDIWRMPMPSNAIRDVQIGGRAKSWLRLNAIKEGDLIVSSGDNQIYYISHLNVAVIPEDPELDRRTRDVTDPRELLHILRQAGARYLLDSRHWNSYYWSRIAERLGSLTEKYPNSIVYHSQDADVVDLAKLEKIIL